MLKNYLLVTFRNLLKNKIFTLINITGLGIALAVCVVAFFNHMFNYDFDRAHENFESIYRVTSFRDMKGTQFHFGWGNYQRPVKDFNKQLEVDVFDVGPEYLSTMGLRLTEGRLFDKLRSEADRSNNSIIVNRKFLPRRCLASDDNYGVLAVRTDKKDIPEVFEYLNQKWKIHAPNYLFNGMRQEDLMQEGKNINASIMKVNIFLAITAALLSLIGMYNLVSIDIIRRTKEIGIRKILGSPLFVITWLAGRKFIIVLAVASILGSAGGYYLSKSLLDSIWDYFVGIKVTTLVLSSMILVVATIATISYKIIVAAMRNPVESLRYE